MIILNILYNENKVAIKNKQSFEKQMFRVPNFDHCLSIHSGVQTAKGDHEF